MPTKSPKIPSLRHHKPTGQAVVRLDGRNVYCGRYGTEAAEERYRWVVAEWLSGVPIRPVRQQNVIADSNALTVAELILRYLQHADGYYRRQDGRPTGEADTIRPLRRLYGRTPARDFGPMTLKAVRQAMIDSGLSRNECNRRTAIVVRAFKWAVENELVPPSIHHGLKSVSGLRKGRTEARETQPVRPVPEAFVEAIRPHVARQIWAMIELQRLTGMRPGEVCIMRIRDLDTTGAVWIYRPETHKTEHHGRSRDIYLGSKAQEVIRPWLRTDLGAYLFSPAEAEAERNAERRRHRKSPMTPSQAARRPVARRHRPPGERYTTISYRRAIKHGIKRTNRILAAANKATFPDWHPNQLRHNAATRLRKEFGLDVARAILGHSSPVVTEVYAERDASLAIRAMESIG